MNYLLSCICLTFSIFTSAGVYTSSAPLHSASRGYREPAASALQRYRQRLALYGVRAIQEDTPLGQAKPIDMLSYERVPAYQSVTVAAQAFAKLRDTKFIKDSNHNMVRRSSWLYPDDGCFARAALAVQNLKTWKMPAPAKLFIFGNLTVKTNNSPNGSVSWWYHVVPIVMVGQQPVVFDPAINSAGPMYLKDWIATMTTNLKTVSFSICKPSSYAPSSPCAADSNSSDPALDHQMMYLTAEWDRVTEMKRDPTKELGDYPPWSRRR
tara:strand:+ start:868 stop:1668 length:801 start_codon:yes stop_codon:yes gene_type:complete